jgi:hypothetical protein
MTTFWSAFRVAAVGAAVGLVFVALGWMGHERLALAVDTNVYASPGVNPAGCRNWRDDTADFPGTGHQFNWYWSGQSTWWDDSAAQACWHNDEGRSNWRAVDYPGSLDQDILYETTVYASNSTPGNVFNWSTAGCDGIDVEMYNIYGQYSGSMHYWHVWIYAGVAGTNTASHYVPGMSIHYRTIGGIRSAGADGCYSTGNHLHPAVYDPTGAGGAVAYRHGNLNSLPMYFR